MEKQCTMNLYLQIKVYPMTECIYYFGQRREGLEPLLGLDAVCIPNSDLPYIWSGDHCRWD